MNVKCMDGGRFMLQFGTELCFSDTKIKTQTHTHTHTHTHTRPQLNGLIHASIKIKKRCATTVVLTTDLQQVFSNNIPHHKLSFSRQRYEVFLTRISHTFSPHFASFGGPKLSHKLCFFQHSTCSRRSHLNW